MESNHEDMYVGIVRIYTSNQVFMLISVLIPTKHFDPFLLWITAKILYMF